MHFFSRNPSRKPTATVHSAGTLGLGRDDIDIEALRIIERLKRSGHQAFVVGGAVRDILVGKRPKDFDIATDAHPGAIKRIFWNSRIIGKRFRLVHVYFDDRIYEVATFRSLKDGSIGNTYGTIEEDVMRRDFTINALYYDPVDEVVLDFVGGVRDVRRKLVRPLIPLDRIFDEDPVRMLRAVKYAASTGFRIPFSARRKIARCSPLLGPVSASRLTEELFKILHSGRARSIILAAKSYGLLPALQPRMAALIDSSDSYRKRLSESLSSLDYIVADKGEKRLGRQMSYLLRDFLDDVIDWEGDPLENYRIALHEAREFIKPINPPRVELEAAIRSVFRRKGLSFSHKSAGNTEKPDPEKPLIGVGGDVRKRKRRRRRRGPKPSAEGGAQSGGNSPAGNQGPA